LKVKRIGSTGGPSEHDVCLTFVKGVTGQLDGVERRGAGAVERERSPVKLQGTGEKMRG
jgi:hypothetical protein